MFFLIQQTEAESAVNSVTQGSTHTGSLFRFMWVKGKNGPGRSLDYQR